MLRMIELPRISREQFILVNTTYHSRLKGPSPRATSLQKVPRESTGSLLHPLKMSPGPIHPPLHHTTPLVPLGIQKGLPNSIKGDILAIYHFRQVGPSNQAPIFKSLRRTHHFSLMLTHWRQLPAAHPNSSSPELNNRLHTTTIHVN